MKRVAGEGGVGETLPAWDPSMKSHTPNLKVCLGRPALCPQKTWVLQEREGLA